MPLFLHVFQVLLAFAFISAIGVYAYFKWTYGYWKRKGIAHLKGDIPLGTLQNPVLNNKPFPVQFREWYLNGKSNGHKYLGVYVVGRPVMVVIDLEIIKTILTRDFDYFTDRGLYSNERIDHLSLSLLSIEGVKWKILRSKLTPAFSTGKLKVMFQTLLDTGKQMRSYIDSHPVEEPIDIKDVASRFVTTTIASVAFGIDCNSFKNSSSKFRKYLQLNGVMSAKASIGYAMGVVAPNLARLLGVRAVKPEVSDFFINVVKETVDYREKNNFVRKDYLQLLLELKNKPVSGGSENDQKLTMAEVESQAFMFLAAGYETTSTAIYFCVYEVARNQHVQQKLREEIHAVLDLYNGEISYDSLKEMEYMDQVIDETLRVHTPFAFLFRKCVSNYKIPGTDTTIDKGTAICISTSGLHQDPDYYYDPETFDPERFSKENRQKIRKFTYLPFGEGPKVCIGLRFAMIQIKIALVVLLKDHEYTLNKRTKMPLEYDSTVAATASLGEIWLDIKRV